MIWRTGMLCATLLVLGCGDTRESEGERPDFAPPPAADTVGGAGRSAQDAVAQSRIDRIAPDTGTIGTVRVLASELADDILHVSIELNSVEPGRHEWRLVERSCTVGMSPDDAAAAIASGTIEVGSAGFGEGSAVVPGAGVREELERGAYSLVIRSGGTITACAAL